MYMRILRGISRKLPEDTLFGAFNQFALDHPCLPALTFYNTTTTYGQLGAMVDTVGRSLSERGITKGSVVAVCLPRSELLVSVIFAIFKLGAVYTPIEPTYPQHILKHIITNSHARFIITTAPYDDLLCPLTNALFISAADLQRPSAPGLGSAHVADVNAPCCIFFTSGTTGRPKGILIASKGIINYRTYIADEFNVGVNDTVLQLASLSFDASLRDLVIPLTLGARVALMIDGQLNNPRLILAHMEQVSATCILSVTPTKLTALVNASRISEEQHPKPLRLILSSGEPLRRYVCKGIWENIAPRTAIVNQYGPSECTMTSTFYRVERKCAYPDGIPIGHPIHNVDMYLVNCTRTSGNELAGEITITGPGTATGYLDPHIKENRNFVTISGKAGFNTQDVGRFNSATGRLLLIGRHDRRIKRSGVWVDLNEIENALQHSGLASSAAVVLTKAGSICAFVGSDCFSEADLYGWCSSHLDIPARPSRFIHIRSLPLTAVGKVDYETLAAFVENTTIEPPVTDTEARLRQIFATVLDTDASKISRVKGFFSLGGDSLALVTLLEEISRVFLVDLVPDDLHQDASPAVLGELIDEKLRSTAGSSGPVYDPLSDITSCDRIAGSVVKRLRSEIETVFLTGATGYVGAYLLRELLGRGKKVICLVRAETSEAAFQRVKTALERYAIWRDWFASAVEVRAGDVTKPAFGLSRAEFIDLSRGVQQIYHCAARVNFVWPCKMLRHENILPLHELIAMAEVNPEIQNLQFLSTDSVFPIRESLYQNPPSEQDWHPDVHSLKDGYSQSKWVAEQICRRIRKKLPVNIYRIGRVLGDTMDGKGINESDLIVNILRQCLRTGRIPRSHSPIYMLPADYAAMMLVELADNENQTYHVFAKEPVSFGRLAALLARIKPTLNEVDVDDWLEALVKDSRTMGHLARHFFHAKYRLASDATRQALFQKTGITDGPGYDYLDKVVGNLVKDG